MEEIEGGRTDQFNLGNSDSVWLQLARETLENNGIDGVEFASSVVSALEDGRKKGNNILLIGEGNYAKSFPLLSLKKMYKCFTNPSTGSFNWIGLESCEVLFLNDFLWSPAVIPWEQLLQICECDDVRINAPKNHCATDKLLPSSRDTPIFGTSSIEIVSNKSGALMVKDTKMMASRWKTFQFTYKIADEDRKKENLFAPMKCTS